MKYEAIDIKTLDKISRLNKLNKELEKENEKLKDSLETMTFTAKIKQEAIDSLIKKMDRAIELIDEPIYYATDKMEIPRFFIKRLKEVKDILQGEDKWKKQ